jgi:hypothetical protein
LVATGPSAGARYQRIDRRYRVLATPPELEELRRRIKATIWPEGETVWEQPKLFTDEVRTGFRSLRA